jgi:PAS domain S-box-containing protein
MSRPRGVPERREAVSSPDLGAAGALERWFAAAPWGLAVVDPQRRLVRVNPAFAQVVGLAAEDAAGRAVGDVLPGIADELEPILHHVLDGGGTVDTADIVGRTRAEPDRDRRFAAACFPMRDDDGAVHGAVVMLTGLPDEDAVDLERRIRDQRMRLAMAGTGTGFWEWEIATDRVRWSDSLGPLHGLARGEAPASYARFLDLVHPQDRSDVMDTVGRASREGGDFAVEFRVVDADGTERWLASRGHAIADDSGRPSVVAGMVADVTERRRREDALTFLAEAGHALAGSLDPIETLNEIALLAVPRLADWCAVQLASDDGGYENVAVAHVDPDKVRWALELQKRYPPDPDAPTGVPQVMRTGRSELYPEIDEELLRAGAQDAEHLEIIMQLRMTSAMVVPLRARDRTLGAITFIFAESGRQYSTHELELAEELGRRAGLALDHARLYEREHRTAETLQRALLPPTLPAIPGHDVAARYLPGRRGDHVGGDWYDAFVLADGRIGIAIGDIGGRGVTAAALMGQMRNGLRAYAFKASGPGAALADVRALGERIDELVFATLAYIVYDPQTGAGIISSAGHLPALVLAADGRASFMDQPRCPPLGAEPDAPTLERPFTLPPGGTLVLYTDGLVESRTRSLEAGLRRLADVAGASAGDVHRLADQIVEVVPDQPQDDIALLALRREG